MRFLHQLTALFAIATLLCVFTACQKEIAPLDDQEPVDSTVSAIDSFMLIKKLRIYNTDPSSDIFDGKDSMVLDFQYDTLNKQIISNSEEGIGVYAFNTDSNLTKIKVGTTMADIVDYMSFDYDNNKNLKKVTVVYDENITYSIDFKTTIQGSLKIIDAIDTAFADERGESDKLGEWRFVVNDKDQLTEMQHSQIIETIHAKQVRITKFTYLSDGSLSAYNVSGYDSSLTNGAKTSLQAYSATYHTRAQAGTQMAQLFKMALLHEWLWIS